MKTGDQAGDESPRSDQEPRCQLGRLDAAEFQLMYDFDDDKKKQSRGTEAILNALILSLMTASRPEKPSEHTRKPSQSLGHPDRAREKQRLMGVAQFRYGTVGVEPHRATWAPPGGGRSRCGPGHGLTAASASRRERLRLLRDTEHEFRHPESPQPRVDALGVFEHRRTAYTWAKKQAHRADPRQAASRRRLEPWRRSAITHGEVKTPATTPDGYATGLILHVLQLAGLPKETPSQQGPCVAAVESRSVGRLACNFGQQEPLTRVDKIRPKPTSANSCGTQRLAMRSWHSATNKRRSTLFTVPSKSRGDRNSLWRCPPATFGPGTPL